MSHTADIVYFSRIRKKEPISLLPLKQKFKQDMLFLEGCVKDASSLSRNSLYNKMIPDFMERVVERLLVGKPMTDDIAGLMGLIMIGGINEEESADWLRMVYANGGNFLFDCQHNLCTLLFGVTYDDVSTLIYTLMNWRVTKTNQYVFP